MKMRKFVKPAAIATATAAVAAGSIAFTLRDASAAAQEGTAKQNGTTVVFDAGTGTANVIGVSPRTVGGFSLHDAAATIKLSGASTCSISADKHSVLCPASITKLTLNLGDGDDEVNGGTYDIDTTIQAGDGEDHVLGGPGNDKILGGPDKDLLYGGFGEDKLEGGAGVDTLYGQAGNDAIGVPTDLDDHLWGSSGQDKLYGGETVHGDDDNDTLYPGINGDLWGGTGVDTLDFSAWTEEVNVSMDGVWNDGGDGNDTTTDPCDDWLPGGCIPGAMNAHGDLENVVGTKFGDVIIGNGAENDFDSGEGNDAIDGRGGDDYLNVGVGQNQRVRGGTGVDTCVGFNITTKTGCDK
jgi:Ca2+-binding RTX toxin-like protein